MGWKTLKDKFNIEHRVTVVDNNILIDGGYISPTVIIDMTTGEISFKEPVPSDFLEKKYPKLHAASPAERLALIRQPDSFSNSTKVYSFKEHRLIEQLCEKPGYPNVTHCGELMYENSHYTDRNEAIEQALNSSKAEIKWIENQINYLTKEIEGERERLNQAKKAVKEISRMVNR